MHSSLPSCSARPGGGGSRRTEAGTAQRTAGTHGAGTLRLVDGSPSPPAASATTPPCAHRRWSTGRTSSTWPRATTTSAPWPDSSASCWIVPGQASATASSTSAAPSLSAMRFMLLIEKRYGVDLPMAALIETPTVEGLAERLRERSAVRAFDPLVPIRAGGSRPPLFSSTRSAATYSATRRWSAHCRRTSRYMPCRRPAPARAVRRWRSSRTSPPVTSRRSAGCSRKAPITSAAGRSAASSPTRWPGNCARSTRRRSPN